MTEKAVNRTQLVSAFRRQFELCALKPGESVAFLSALNSDQDIIAAGLTAASEMGNVAYDVRVARPPSLEITGQNPLNAPGVIDALSKANLICTFFPSFFTPWEQAARANGGRILNICDTPDELVRLQGTPELKRAVIAARDRLEKASKVHVTSDAGTDLSWIRDPKAGTICHYGFCDEPGKMDHWGQGMVAMFPEEGSAQGKVVVSPGDVWILPYARMVRSRIELEVRDGFIRKIEGDEDAKMFSHWLNSCKLSDNDLDPFALSHLGWGLNPRARWDDVIRYENQMEHLQASMRAYPGNFLFSTGPSPTRKTKGHIDMPMNDCTIALDGEEMVHKGHLVYPDMIVDPERKYH